MKRRMTNRRQRRRKRSLQPTGNVVTNQKATATAKMVVRILRVCLMPTISPFVASPARKVWPLWRSLTASGRHFGRLRAHSSKYRRSSRTRLNGGWKQGTSPQQKMMTRKGILAAEQAEEALEDDWTPEELDAVAHELAQRSAEAQPAGAAAAHAAASSSPMSALTQGFAGLLQQAPSAYAAAAAEAPEPEASRSPLFDELDAELEDCEAADEREERAVARVRHALSAYRKVRLGCPWTAAEAATLLPFDDAAAAAEKLLEMERGSLPSPSVHRFRACVARLREGVEATLALRPLSAVSKRRRLEEEATTEAVQREQLRTDLVLPPGEFRALVREISSDFMSGLTWTDDALSALQVAAEACLVAHFNAAGRIAQCGGAEEVCQRHLQLARDFILKH